MPFDPAITDVITPGENVDQPEFIAWAQQIEAACDDALKTSADATTGDRTNLINKATTGDTASIRFTTGLSGRAELGLIGNNNLTLKTSSDGATWLDAISVSSAGWVGLGKATTPVSRLHVADDGGLAVVYETSAQAVSYLYRRANGTVSAKTIVANGDAIASLAFQGYDGAAYRSAAQLLCQVDNVPGASDMPGKLVLATTADGGSATIGRLQIDSAGVTAPVADNTYTLGKSTNRWASVWAANGTIQTSDERDKNILGRVDGNLAASAVDAIEPIYFQWKIGGYEVSEHPTETEVDAAGDTVPKAVLTPVPGTRTHAGFSAQEVKAAMDAAGVDFGVWGLEDVNDPESRQWLRPDQIIPVLWAALRQTRADLAELRAQLET